MQERYNKEMTGKSLSAFEAFISHKGRKREDLTKVKKLRFYSIKKWETIFQISRTRTSPCGSGSRGSTTMSEGERNR